VMEPQTKETLGALSTGITAFITTVFISWTEDNDDSTLADHIRDAFWKTFKPSGGWSDGAWCALLHPWVTRNQMDLLGRVRWCRRVGQACTAQARKGGGG
jgi:hypothetical protein